MKRDHFAWQHTMKGVGGGGCGGFLLVLLLFLGFLQQRNAVWLSGVSPCKVHPVTNDQCPAILKWQKWL